VLIDCDNFRDINERHGHSSGDRVLTEMAQRLGESLRPEDSLARIRGDEFLVLLPNVKQPQALVINIVTEVSIHPELPRCRSASGAHVLEYAARRFSLRLAFRAAPNFIDHVFNFHFDPQTR
jgi:diguanylate cyclase (GGDEF)-like protein